MRVVSPTKLVVAAPKGAAAVYVTVAAEGGRSAPVAASRFSY